jgi:hypothetical protein
MLNKTGRQHVLTAESDVTAFRQTPSSKSIMCQEVHCKCMSINNFDRAVSRRSVLSSTALEPAFAWHGWFLSYNTEGRTK